MPLFRDPDSGGSKRRVYWFLRRYRGHVYLVKVEVMDGRQRVKWVENVEAMEQVMDYVKKKGPKPYHRLCGGGPKELGVSGVAPRAGFEPARGLPPPA